MACLFAGPRILDDLVENLFDLAEPEFNRNFLIFPANAQFQPVAGLLFLQPSVSPSGHFSAVPAEDYVSCSQSCHGRNTFGIDLPHDEWAIRLMLYGEAERGPPLLHRSQSQTCQPQDLLIWERLRPCYICCEKFLERAASDALCRTFHVKTPSTCPLV
jgi:hypothetical protein